MLFFTKEELKSRISCIKQMMDALNIKMNYFENLLHGLECSSTEKHCLIINVSFADVPMDAFMECDTIEVISNSDSNFNERDKVKVKSKTTAKPKRTKSSRIINIEPQSEAVTTFSIKQEKDVLPSNTYNFDELPQENLIVPENYDSLNSGVSLPVLGNDCELSDGSPEERGKFSPSKHQNQFISESPEDQTLMSIENGCSILSSLIFNEPIESLHSPNIKSKLFSQNIPMQSSNPNQFTVMNNFSLSHSNNVFPTINSHDLVSNTHINSIPDYLPQIDERNVTVHRRFMYNNYMFVYHRKMKDGMVHWRCKNHGKTKCRARLHTRLGKIVKLPLCHNH